MSFLQKDEISNGPLEAKKLRKEALKYVLIFKQLCLDLDEAEHAMKEVHKGVCGTHIGDRALVSKITRAGYYWPTLIKDCMEFLRRCDER
ncbi:hypothetical protein CR513_41886, partial [Mucuna pruriens]